MAGWAKVDVGFFRHPQVVGLRPTQQVGYLAMILYSQEYETDGAVPDEALRVCGITPADVKAIHDAGLLTVSGSTWHIDGFQRKPVTSAVLETKRQQARDNRKRSGNDPERKRNASANDSE